MRRSLELEAKRLARPLQWVLEDALTRYMYDPRPPAVDDKPDALEDTA